MPPGSSRRDEITAAKSVKAAEAADGSNRIDAVKAEEDDSVSADTSTESEIFEKEKIEEKETDVGETKTPSRGSTSADSFNNCVLEVIDTFSSGSYPYLLNNDYANYNGVTENIYYQGGTLAKAHPSGSRASHCTGITFEVFFKAIHFWNQRHGLPQDNINNMSFNEMQDFMLTWYVANGPKSISNLSAAVENYGLGSRITNWEEAKAGDFIDFSRTTGTGHTAVFLSWIWDNGNIIGFNYWSSQGSTGGIAYNTEYFSGSGGSVMHSPFYIARVKP